MPPHDADDDDPGVVALTRTRTSSVLERFAGAWRLWRSAGRRGERLAARHLKRQGYRIRGRNIRTRAGEIDLLAESPDHMVVVVEVKTTEMASRGDNAPDPVRPEVRVSAAKQRQLTALATQVARRLRLDDRPIRFDVVAVELRPEGRPVVRHHPAAFEAAW